MTSAIAPTSAAGPEEAAGNPQERLAAPIRLAGPQPRSSTRLRLAALLAALAAHAAVLYALTREPPDLMAGGHGHLLEAVNVTMVNSAVFEARQDLPAPPAPAIADAVEASEGTIESKPSPLRSEQKEEAKGKKVLDEPVPAEAIVKAPPKAPEAPQMREKERKDASAPADATGGAATRGNALSSAKQSAPAAASPGAVREYADSVQRALAGAKPKGPRGFTVRVKLLVSSDGRIEIVEILKSSGSKNLDSAVLAAVQRVKLPMPPPGLAFEERWYEFPVHFR